MDTTFINNKDCFGSHRGKCRNCQFCQTFVSENGSVKCAFCNCAPVLHELEERQLSLTHGLSTNLKSKFGPAHLKSHLIEKCHTLQISSG